MEVYLGECAGRVRARTLGRYRRELRGALESPLLGADLSRHTKAALRAYLDTVASPNTRRHIRSARSALYGWLIDRDLMDVNPAALVKLPKTVLGAPVILSLEETQRLLDAAAIFRGGSLLPYVAICLFAGLRPTEAMRLRTEDVGREYIRLTADQVKTAFARTVTIQPNLRDILDRCRMEGPTVIPCKVSSFQPIFARLVALAGIEWTQDVMRHSYGSYAYERTRDAAATAYEMGHKSNSIFFRHYRGLVLPGDGERYFNLRPNWQQVGKPQNN